MAEIEAKTVQMQTWSPRLVNFSSGKEFIAHDGPWSKVTESGDENPVKAEEEIEAKIARRQTWSHRVISFPPRIFSSEMKTNWCFARKGPWESKVTESGDENPVKAEEENKENTNRSGKMELVDDLTPISLPQDAGLSLSSFLGLQKNMVLFSKTDVPIVLTFCTDPDSDAALTYNRKLATLLLRKMRKFVDEDFTFAFGVVGEDDTESLLDRVKTLREKSTRFALRRYLIMTPEKCESLTRGLVSMLSEMKL